ncbi:MAG: hypothetical protein R2784_09170 [Saprospiraceae bacterium]
MKDEDHPEKGIWTYGPVRVLDALRTDRYPQLKGFHRRDLEMLEKTFGRFRQTSEKNLFKVLYRIHCKGAPISKNWSAGIGRNQWGSVLLWLSSFEEKEAAFDIISHLQIEMNQAGEEEPVIVFRKTEKTNPLANFRVGDIAALYPFEKLEDTVLRSQVFKVTIIGLGKDHISVRLRSRQNNLSIFERNCLWNLEHDLLDSSFNSMYRSLFEFSSAQKEKGNCYWELKAIQQGILPDFQPAMELTSRATKCAPVRK